MKVPYQFKSCLKVIRLSFQEVMFINVWLSMLVVSANFCNCQYEYVLNIAIARFPSFLKFKENVQNSQGFYREACNENCTFSTKKAGNPSFLYGDNIFVENVQ
jgi:hypothetical protein